MEIITSRKNRCVSEYKALSSHRDSECFPAEGAKLISESLRSGIIPKYALITNRAKAKYSDTFKELSEFCNVTEISPEIADYISDTKTPQGIFAALPRYTNIIDLNNLGKRYIILDGISDPGNAGTIIRSCEAFGFDGVFLSENSCDIYSAKASRSAMGSLFRIPVYADTLTRIILSLSENEFAVYAAVPDDTAHNLRGISKTDKIAVVIGNEASGISDAVLSLCANKVYIPIKGAESLNAAVAASVICYEFGE